MTTRIAYQQIAFDKLSSILAAHGFVEVEMSRFHARAFIRIVEHHQYLDDYAFTQPTRSRRNWDFFVGIVRLADYMLHFRLIELMSFWKLHNAAVGWQQEKDGKYIFGFLCGRNPETNSPAPASNRVD